jgi:hypothetical protein
MNQYQRMGILLVRLAGGTVILVGTLGAVYAAAVDAGLTKDPPGRPTSLAVSLAWVAGGAALLLLSGRLGRWLGRGLD